MHVSGCGMLLAGLRQAGKERNEGEWEGETWLMPPVAFVRETVESINTVRPSVVTLADDLQRIEIQ